MGSRSCSNQPNLVWSIPGVGRLFDKKNFWYILPRKKVSFSYGNLRLFQISNFKNKSFLSGQEVVQIKPNLAWSIPGVGRLCNKKNFWYSLPRKKLVFRTEICDYFK